MIAYLLHLYRMENKVTTRKLAKQIGVEHTCLWRFENGKSIESRSFAKILNWLLTSRL